MYKLTRATYFSPERPHVSNSMVGDFLLSKEYYKARHIDRTLPKRVTPAMQVGSIVDALLMGEKPAYEVKVLKKDDPARYDRQKSLPPESLVTEDQMERAYGLAHAIRRQPFFQEYLNKKASFQYLLESEVHGIPVCGLADIVTFDGDTIYLDDVKTTNPGKVRWWESNCADMGYVRQLGAYRMMLREQFPNMKVVCRHVVAYEETDGLYRVMLFVFDDRQVDAGEAEFRAGVWGIANETAWKDAPVTWEDARKLPYAGSYDFKEAGEDEGTALENVQEMP